MNTQNVEIGLLSHDELDAVCGGGILTTVAHIVEGAIEAGTNFLLGGMVQNAITPPVPRLPAL
jgi:hypothetical protein